MLLPGPKQCPASDFKPVRTAIGILFALPRSLRLCLPVHLLQHLSRQGLQCPSRQALQRSRIELDLASMIYSRRYVLNSTSTWWMHLRADSSPQGGRDFFIAEYDLCKFEAVEANLLGVPVPTLLETGRMKLVTRLLPLSVIGCRAASAVHKGRNLLKSLALDSEDLRVRISRTMTMMFDFGAEAGLQPTTAMQQKQFESSEVIIIVHSSQIRGAGLCFSFQFVVGYGL